MKVANTLTAAAGDSFGMLSRGGGRGFATVKTTMTWEWWQEQDSL